MLSYKNNKELRKLAKKHDISYYYYDNNKCIVYKRDYLVNKLIKKGVLDKVQEFFLSLNKKEMYRILFKWNVDFNLSDTNNILANKLIKAHGRIFTVKFD